MDPQFKEVKKIIGNVDGFLTDEEGIFLYMAAKNCVTGVIVEIGSWKGKSTICLAKGSKAGGKERVYAIDPHTGASEHKKAFGKIWTFDEFKRNIKNAKVDDIVIPIIKTSKDAEKEWAGMPVGLLWIDGAHEYEFVKLDYELWEPHLIEGGLIVFHDTHSENPKKIVNEYLYNGTKFKDVNFVDTITYATKSSNISHKDKIKNRYVLGLRETYLFFGKMMLPRQIKIFLKQLAKMVR